MAEASYVTMLWTMGDQETTLMGSFVHVFFAIKDTRHELVNISQSNDIN